MQPSRQQLTGDTMSVFAQTIARVSELARCPLHPDEFLRRAGDAIKLAFQADNISISFRNPDSGELFQYAASDAFRHESLLSLGRRIELNGVHYGFLKLRSSSIVPDELLEVVEAIELLVKQIARFAEFETERCRQSRKSGNT